MTESDNYIFFLQFEEKLPRFYFTLYQVLKHLNISLVPVGLEELQNLPRQNGHHVLAITHNLRSKNKLQKMWRSYFELSLLHDRYQFHHISSYEAFSWGSRIRGRNNYYYYQLPLDMKKLVAQVATIYFQEKNKSLKWPGGRRAKLPIGTNKVKEVKL